MADRLAMLTQRVAASSCAMASGVDVETAESILSDSAAAFETILSALRDGDATLGMPKPERNARILHDIDALAAEWAPTRVAIDALLADGTDVGSAHVIDDHNMALLRLATQLTVDISGRYSHPYEISQMDAMLVKLAGRQRMLTQKMAKDACEIWTGYNAEAARTDLSGTKQIFDVSIRALRHGKPELGLPSAPNVEIAQELDYIIARWDSISANADALLAGATLDADQKFDIFRGLEEELGELDLVLHQYLAHAERHH